MPPNDVGELAPPTSVVHQPLPHDSARLHVRGSATYVDDIREPDGTLHVAIGIALDQLAHWERWLAARGVEIESRVTWSRGGKSLYFRDPGGHSVELVTPGTWDNF